MGKAIVKNNGNDKIMTPPYLAEKIVNHFRPNGKILEPCCGTGAFLQYLPNADYCEIDKGLDFLKTKGKWDWIITNPPYSKYRDFLIKSMEVADNIVFLQLINATFYKTRLRDIATNNFSIKEMYFVDTPKEFPQFGFQLGCVYYKRDYKDTTKIVTSCKYLSTLIIN